MANEGPYVLTRVPLGCGQTALTAGQGWADNGLFRMRMADVNGDGRADVVGFGTTWMCPQVHRDGYCALSPARWVGALPLNAGQGWLITDLPHAYPDVNGDGKMPMCAGRRADFRGCVQVHLAAFTALSLGDGTFVA